MFVSHGRRRLVAVKQLKDELEPPQGDENMQSLSSVREAEAQEMMRNERVCVCVCYVRAYVRACVCLCVLENVKDELEPPQGDENMQSLSSVREAEAHEMMRNERVCVCV